MSGIRTGTRAEALAALLRRTRHEVAQARRNSSRELPRLLELEDRLHVELALPPPVRPVVGRRPVPRPQQPTQERLRALGVTSLQIKTWALEQGLITELKRGRVPPALVDAYAARLAQTAPKNGVNAQA